MESDSVGSLSPEKLARLLDIEALSGGAHGAEEAKEEGVQGGGDARGTVGGVMLPHAGEAWSERDVAEALRHELSAPLLLPDILEAHGAEREKLERMAGEGQTFLEALTSAGTPVELLDAIKQFARYMRGAGSGQLSEGPATVLYYAAIAAALVGDGGRITKLPDEQIRVGIQWARQQGGTEQLQTLFSRALQHLNPVAS